MKIEKVIKEMIEYCYLNNIDTIYVSEFTRLGRKEKIIIDGIRFLRKNGINKIYIVSENIVIDDDSLKNNYKEIIELAKAAEKERDYITNRLSAGRDQYILKCRKNGIKMGRPSTYKKSDDTYLTQYIEDIKLIKEKKSLRQINAITGTSIMTIRKIKEILKRNNILN